MLSKVSLDSCGLQVDADGVDQGDDPDLLLANGEEVSVDG